MLEIKSKFVIKKITKNLAQKRLLQLMKYNKKIQEKLDISINDYREYNQIEFKLYPNDKIGNIFLNSINMDKNNIHIYINHDKIENGSIIEHNDIIKKIKLVIDPEIKSLSSLFNGFDNIDYIECIKFNRKDIIDMSKMFYGCKNLMTINIEKFKTDNVTNMSYMFHKCLSLFIIDIKNFNTKNVLNMQNMFDDCSELRQLDLNNFDTSNVIYMNDMFHNCKNLKLLNI